jgi:hypothetical protein
MSPPRSNNQGPLIGLPCHWGDSSERPLWVETGSGESISGGHEGVLALCGLEEVAEVADLLPEGIDGSCGSPVLRYGDAVGAP